MKRMAWLLAAVWLTILLLRSGSRGVASDLFGVLDTVLNALAKMTGQPRMEELLAEMAQGGPTRSANLADAAIVALPVLVGILLFRSLLRIDYRGTLSGKRYWSNPSSLKAATGVRLLCELSPVLLMSIGNAYSLAFGTWALLVSTLISVIVMLLAFRQVPILPLLLIVFTGIFGIMTLITGDATWVQAKARWGDFVALTGSALVALREWRRSRAYE